MQDTPAENIHDHDHTHTHSRLSAHTHTCLLRHTQTPTHTHMHTHHAHTDMHTRAHGFPRTGTCTHIHMDQQPAAFKLPHKVPLLAQVEGGSSLPVSTDPQSQQRRPEYVTLHISETRRGGPGHRWGHHMPKPPLMLKRTPQAVAGGGGAALLWLRVGELFGDSSAHGGGGTRAPRRRRG